MPASVSSSTVAPSASAAIRPGSRACSTDLVEGHHPAGERHAEVGGQPVQPAGVLDGQHVGGRHHLAQPRARRRPGCPSGAPPSTSRPVTLASLSRRTRRPATYPGGMAVLAPERAEEEPPPSAASGARPPPPARGPGATARPPLPGDSRLAWLLAAALGLLTPGQPAVGHRLPDGPALRRGLLPARGRGAAALGLRVQPRLHVHRPSAAGQVADRDRRGCCSATTRSAGGSPRRWPARSPSSSWPGWPGG